MRKTVIAIVALLAVAALAGYVASPYVAFYELQTAAKAGDRDGLEDGVDFPAVREDFKAQLNGALMAKTQSDPKLKGNPFVAIGLLIAPAVIDRMIDAYVTPEAIAQMVVNARAPKPGAPRTPSAGNAHVSSRYAYASLNRFKVAMIDDTRPDKPITFVLERRGVFAWKLVRIELPLDRLGS